MNYNNYLMNQKMNKGHISLNQNNQKKYSNNQKKRTCFLQEIQKKENKWQKI